MLKGFIKRRAHILYIQIWENRIKAVNINNGQLFDEKPLVAIIDSDGKKKVTAIGNQASFAKASNTKIINPFSHPRIILSDFSVAEKLFQHIIKLLKPKILSPIVVIQAMDKTEGGLTQIERRALRELAYGAGAMDVFLDDGVEELDRAKINELIEELDPSVPIRIQNRIFNFFILGIVIIALFDLVNSLIY
jgi:rod shape-determining protein MreB